MQELFYPDPLVRLPFYAALGLMTEVLFTGTFDLLSPLYLQSWNAKNPDGHRPALVRRDPKAMGYTFLWMIPLYMLLITMEPLSRWLHPYPFWARGLIYLTLFWVGEYASGAFIKKISGYVPWDYSYSRFSVHGYIRWDFAPFWFAFTLIVEYFIPKFVFLTPAIRAAFS